jgi:hypothetical protein
MRAMTRAQTRRYLHRQRRRQVRSGFIAYGTRRQLARLQAAAFDGHYCQIWTVTPR